MPRSMAHQLDASTWPVRARCSGQQGVNRGAGESGACTPRVHVAASMVTQRVDQRDSRADSSLAVTVYEALVSDSWSPLVTDVARVSVAIQSWWVMRSLSAA